MHFGQKTQKQHSLNFTAVRCSFFFAAFALVPFTGNALEGTAFFHTNAVSTYDSCGIDGIWRVDIATGRRTQLFGDNDGSSIIDFAILSWDGRKIGFSFGGKIYAMDNDGENLSRLDGISTPGSFSWTRNGIYFGHHSWEGNAKLYHYDPETQNERIVLTFSGKTYMSGWRGAHGSATGENIWSRMYYPSSCGTVPSDDGCDGPAYFHFSRDGHLLKMFGWRDWGHPETMTMCGRYMCNQIFDSHNGFWIRNTADGQTEQSFTYGPVDSMKSNRWDHHEVYPVRCMNHPDLFIFKVLGRWASNFSKETRRGYYKVYNLKTDEFECDVPNPVDGTTNLKCGPVKIDYAYRLPLPFGLWTGNDLPFPNETRAHILPLDNAVHFDVGGETGTVSKAVEVLNLCGPAMSSLSVQISPSNTPWLYADINRLYGNKQYCLLQVDPDLVPSGTSEATVTLSASGARNSASISVTVNKNRLAQPTHFKASKVDETSGTPALLTWTDNSTAEDGYIIEICTTSSRVGRPVEHGSCFGKDQEYARELARVGSDVTSYVYSSGANHAINHYRVRAYSASLETSRPSNAAKFFASHALGTSDSRKVDGWITMTEPRQGFSYSAGQNISIAWISANTPRVNIEYSIDYGATWHSIAAGISTAAGYHHEHAWAVPFALDGESAIVRVIDADDPDIRSTRIAYVKDLQFGESSVAAAALSSRFGNAALRDVRLLMNNGMLHVRHAALQNLTITLFQSNGRILAQTQASPNGVTVFPIPRLNMHVYFVRLETVKASYQTGYVAVVR